MSFNNSCRLCESFGNSAKQYTHNSFHMHSSIPHITIASCLVQCKTLLLVMYKTS